MAHHTVPMNDARSCATVEPCGGCWNAHRIDRAPHVRACVRSCSSSSYRTRLRRAGVAEQHPPIARQKDHEQDGEDLPFYQSPVRQGPPVRSAPLRNQERASPTLVPTTYGHSNHISSTRGGTLHTTGIHCLRFRRRWLVFSWSGSGGVRNKDSGLNGRGACPAGAHCTLR